jgi:hypothetical protein
MDAPATSDLGEMEMRTHGICHNFATAVAAVAFVVSAASPAFAQTTTSQGSQAPERPPNLERIREGVNNPPQLIIDDGKLRIYVEVIAKWPRFDELVKGYDLRNGPTKRGAVMTHQEFLQMVTPREMYSSAGIRPGEVLTMALVNWVGKAIVTRGLEAIKNARSEREIQEIRERIDRELAALRGGK